VELAGGIPFVSDAQLEQGLEDDTDVSGTEVDAIVETNADARIEGLRAAIAVLALIALVGMFFLQSIPTRQPSDLEAEREDRASGGDGDLSRTGSGNAAETTAP
jgi:hypothetical protein